MRYCISGPVTEAAGALWQKGFKLMITSDILYMCNHC